MIAMSYVRSAATLVSWALCLTVAFPATAQQSCADWNTQAFFEVATANDVSRCLTAGADPGAPDEDGWTPLHTAAANGTTPSVVEALLDAGADPRALTRDGLTPLHVAAAFSPSVVQGASCKMTRLAAFFS